MSSAPNDRNLLLGILALQMDFIKRDDLVAGMNAWVLDKKRPLGEILVERHALGREELVLLDALVAKHLAKHDNDPQKSLAAISSVASPRRDLRQIADEDVQASLVKLSPAAEKDPFATLSRSASDGPVSERLRFRVLYPHAEGGLGQVSVAMDEEFRRKVAFKEIKPRAADNPGDRARFLLEAEITGGLEHPGIVPVYSLGTYADGRPFYAMRFIKGSSLRDAISEYHKGEKSTVELHKLMRRFVDVCYAIAYAHDKGVLHRDLKPGNIMVGKYGETLVVDWGLAKLVNKPEAASPGDAEEESVRLSADSSSVETLAGSALGTPAYMSPEQAEGKLDELGPTTDVYSLGATLYHLLAGRPPFEKEGVGEILQKVRKGDFPAPRSIDPSIAMGLEAICLKSMALKPIDRYASAKDLASEIERWLADEPIAAMPDPITVKLRRLVARHRVLVSSAAAALVVAVIGLVAFSLVLGRANEQLAHSEADTRLANEQLTDSRNLEMKARVVAENSQKEAANQRDEAIRQTKLAEEGRREAEKQRALADLAQKSAAEQRNLALNTLKSVVFDIQSGLVNVPAAHDVRARLLRTAISGLDNVVRSVENSTAHDHSLFWAYVAIGDILRESGADGAIDRTKQARDHYRTARDIAEREVQADPKGAQAQRDLLVSYSQLGDVNRDLGDSAAARDSYQHGLEISQKLAQADPKSTQGQRDLAITYTKLGDLSRDLGETAAARDYYQRELVITQTLAKADPKSGQEQRALSISYDRLGDVSRDLGDAEAGRDYYKLGLQIRRKLTQADPSSAQGQRDLSTSYNQLGDASRDLGESEAARDYYRLGFEIRQKLAQDDPGSALAQRQLSLSYGKFGDVSRDFEESAKARDYYKLGLGISQKLALTDPSSAVGQRDLCYFYSKLGDVSRELEEAAAARNFYKLSWEVRQKLAQTNPGSAQAQHDLSIAYNQLGDASRDLGQIAVARDYYMRGLALSQKLAKAEPSSVQTQRDLWYSYYLLGDLERREFNYPEAGNWYGRSVAVLEEMKNMGGLSPKDERFIEICKRHAQQSAAALRAVDDIDFALGQPAENIEELLAARLRVWSRKGDAAETARTAEAFLSLPGKKSDNYYNAACGFALSIAAVAPGKKAGEQTASEGEIQEKYAHRALELLRQAIESGYDDLANMRRDPDLIPLRERDDFRALVGAGKP